MAKLSPNKCQFKFRTILFVVATSAIGLSTLRHEPRSYGDAMLWTVAACSAAVLVRQCAVIWKAGLSGTKEIALDVKTGAWLQIGWRSAVAAAFVAIYVTHYVLIPARLITLSDHNFIIEWTQNWERLPLSTVFVFCLVIALFSRAPQKTRGCGTTFLNCLAWPIVVLGAVAVWTTNGWVHGLVLIAIRGVTNSWPLHWRGIETAQSDLTAIEHWPSFAAAAVIAGAINLTTLWQLLATKKGQRSFILLVFVCASTLAATVGHAVWLLMHGITAISDAHRLAYHHTSPIVWLMAAFLIVSLTSAFTLRALYQRECNGPSDLELPVAAVQVPRTLAALSCAASLLWLVEEIVRILPQRTSLRSIVEFVAERLVLSPLALLVIALLLCSIHGLLPSRQSEPVRLITLLPARFVAIWTVTLVAITCTVISITSWSVAFWLSEWFQRSSFVTLFDAIAWW